MCKTNTEKYAIEKVATFSHDLSRGKFAGVVPGLKHFLTG